MLKPLYPTLLLAILSLQLFASKADWVIPFYTSDRVITKDIVIDSEGYSYSTGLFYDTLIIQTPGNSDTLIDKRFGETFIGKMDSCGNLIWAKQFSGQSHTEPRSIALNYQGQIIITGTFSAETDFDPSPNTFLVDPEGGDAIYISILDKYGNLINVGRLGGSPGMYTPNVAIDDTDNIYISAAFSGGAQNVPVDIDPDLNRRLELKPTGLDGIILKLDPLGNLIWYYHVRGSGDQIFAGDITTKGSEIYVCFHFWGEVIFDTGSATQTLVSRTSKYDGLLINLSSSKQFFGYTHLVGTENVIARSVKSSKSNGIYLSGYFNDTLFVPFKGQSLKLATEGNYDSYVGNWSTNGTLRWIKQFSSKKEVYIYSMDVGIDGNIYLAGRFQDTLNFRQGANPLISMNSRNLFIAVLDSNGNFLHAEKLDVQTTKVNHIAIDKKGNMLGFSSFNNANFQTYDGDTSFLTNGKESALLFKLSNEVNRIHLGNDKSICDNDSLILKPALHAGDEVKWSTGETTPSIMVKTAGIYHVRVSNCGRIFRDTIEITTVPKPVVQLGADTAFCEDQEYLLQPFILNAQRFIWNTNDTNKNLLIKKTGEYILRAENGPYCFAQDSIWIDYFPYPKVFFFDDTVLCGLDEYVLDAGNDGSSYFWSTGEKSQKITITTDGLYSVKVTKALCSTVDSVTITFLKEEDCLPSIIVPTVFTPNNDGNNDFFMLLHKNIDAVEMQVYNKWGQLVFESTSKDFRWDGRIQGKPLPEGSYAFVLQYNYLPVGTTDTIAKKIKGTVALLR